MKTAKAYVSGLIAACMSFFIVADSAAQSIKTDPILQAAIARQNWEPGGKYFSFGSVRGTADPSSRTGQVNINQASAVTVGSFSLQSATINGSYGFISRFSGHPYTDHSPFDNSTSSSASVKDQRPDGSQTSYSLQWTGTAVHPADGYDGVQGGGYPAPAGARDIYNFSIKGLATATYLVSSTDLQATEKPGFWQRTGNFGLATVNNVVEGGKTGAQGIVNIGFGLWYGYGKQSLDGAADLVNGVSRILFSGFSGAIEGYAGPELGGLYTSTANSLVTSGFNDLSIERQYSTLQSFQGAGEFLAENELLVKLAEAGLNVSAIGGSAKTVLWSGEKAAVGVAGVGADVNLSLSSVFNDVKGAGTVWDSIKATQETWPGTVIPKSFEMTTGNGSVWVHANATEHLAEYAAGMASRGVGSDMVAIGSQVQMSSLKASVEAVTSGGVPYNQLINAGGWELKFAPPRVDGQLPALIHAMPVK